MIPCYLNSRGIRNSEKQNQFYDSVGSSETNTGSLMPYREPSAYVQQQMDAKTGKILKSSVVYC